MVSENLDASTSLKTVLFKVNVSANSKSQKRGVTKSG